MELVFLGTAGAETTPKVGCLCPICQEARHKSGRFVRNGPSVFLTEAKVLFDTPEDVDKSLEREGIHEVRHLVYTHWHPDHTGGRRVLEQLNMDWLDPKARRITHVWLPSWVREDFRKRLGLEDNLEYFERAGIARIHELGEGEPFQLDGMTVRPFKMAQPGLTAYILERESKRLVLALDDTKDWKPGTEFSDADLLVLETGWFEHDREGRVIVPPGHFIRQEEASFEETLGIVERINPRRAVMTHIEQLWARSYADYLELEKKHYGHKLQFAYDGLRIKL
jgi:phosphoribosyl 1,2-cyclic phosphate phosphodiesterase